jgi:hypothetical protein
MNMSHAVYKDLFRLAMIRGRINLKEEICSPANRKPPECQDFLAPLNLRLLGSTAGLETYGNLLKPVSKRLVPFGGFHELRKHPQAEIPFENFVLAITIPYQHDALWRRVIHVWARDSLELPNGRDDDLARKPVPQDPF